MTSKKTNLVWIFKTFLIIAIGGTLLGGGVVGAVFWHFSHDLPNIITIDDYHPALVTQIVAVGPSGASPIKPQVIGEFSKMRRYLVPYDKIPQRVVQAFISAEDDKFFEHTGINISSMIRAGLANLRAGKTVQGASTITQQVAKSLLLTPEKHYDRKIKEIILATRIERHLSKQQILYLYLNEIYLGHGSYGIEAASQTYFRKPISQVNVAEAALLAGLPQAPGNYSPVKNPKKAKERQIYVLHRMMENGYINRQQMQEAIDMPLRIYDEDDINRKYAPYLVEHLRRYLLAKYGEDELYEGGMTVLVPTTAAYSLTALKAVRSGLEAVDKRIGYRGPLEHLAPEKLEEWVKQSRIDLAQKKFECKILTPTGKGDPLGAAALAGITDDDKLLDVGERYRAFVTDVDNTKKTASARVGNARITLPFEKIKWAHTFREQDGQRIRGPEPRLPSQVLKSGDVILVKIDSVANGGASGELDQEPQIQGALLSIEAETGYVLAMQGGYDIKNSEFNRAIQAQRQPGSSFKPILYSAALEKGFNPASIIVDSPIVYQDADSKWKPSNFEEKFYGDTTFRQALIHSRNIPTIKILQQIQIPFFLDYAKRLGVTAELPSDLSISLGSASMSLLDMVKLYSLFPRLGHKITPIFYTKILDRNGKTIEEQTPPKPTVPAAVAAAPTAASSPAPASAGGVPVFPTYPLPNDPDQVMDPRVAFVMTHLMTEVVSYGTGHEAQQLGRPNAGKTGTASDFIDAWYMGFTPHVITGTWVGFDNHRTIGPLETGARAALPIWLDYMHEAVKSYPNDEFTVPPGVVFSSIDQNTGKLVPPNSLRSIQEAFIEGTQPNGSSDGNPTGGNGARGTRAAPPAETFKEDVE
ncbi:MAG: PBP1A family penicillin-binding protein [Oligoflexia bacterium]|nr:PBP1A family penicillin-binding protein [Oligoflexia bacterium]